MIESPASVKKRRKRRNQRGIVILLYLSSLRRTTCLLTIHDTLVQRSRHWKRVYYSAKKAKACLDEVSDACVKLSLRDQTRSDSTVSWVAISTEVGKVFRGLLHGLIEHHID